MPWRSTAAGPHVVRQPAIARAAGRNIAVAGARRLWADPEGVQLAVLEMEAELHCLAGDAAQVIGALPAYRRQRLVGADRNTVGRTERGNDFALVVQHRRPQFTRRGVHV